MFDPTTTIACDGGSIVLSVFIANMMLEHVIVRPIALDGTPGNYEFRHNIIVPNDIQTGMGTTLVVAVQKETYTLICGSNLRIWVEPPKDMWVPIAEVQVNDSIFIFNGFGNKTNELGRVTSVVDVDPMSGQQLVLENEVNSPIGVYASGMLVSIPY